MNVVKNHFKIHNAHAQKHNLTTHLAFWALQVQLSQCWVLNPMEVPILNVKHYPNTRIDMEWTREQCNANA